MDKKTSSQKLNTKYKKSTQHKSNAMKILMVCLGNICRSPLAHGILQQKVTQYNLDWLVDSAGTSGWHDGESPDIRAIQMAKKYDIDISKQTSRKINPNDYYNFDLILTMDDANYRDVLRMCPDSTLQSKIMKIITWNTHYDDYSVPDPYYDDRFQYVYNVLDHVCQNIILDFLSDKGVYNKFIDPS